MAEHQQQRALGVVSDMMGTTSPWLAIAKSGLSLVGQILSKIPDRNSFSAESPAGDSRGKRCKGPRARAHSNPAAQVAYFSS